MTNYEKWSPIIDILLDNKEISITDDIKLFFANYAEHHSQLDNQLMMTSDYSSTLPISLKLLSMLNLNGVELNIIDMVKPKMKMVKSGVGFVVSPEKDAPYEISEISILVTKDQIHALSNSVNKNPGIDIITRIESLLLEESAKEINKKLETNKKLDIYMMVNSLNLKEFVEHGNGIKEKLKHTKISISSMIKIS